MAYRNLLHLDAETWSPRSLLRQLDSTRSSWPATSHSRDTRSRQWRP